MKRKLVSTLLTLGVTMSLLSGCANSSSTTTSSTTAPSAENAEATTSVQEDEIDCGDIVFYTTLGNSDHVSSNDNEYEDLDHEVTLTTIQDYPIYNIDWVNVGYIKSGVTIKMEAIDSTKTFRIKNPYDVVDYDYLYIDSFIKMDYGTFSDAYTYDEYWALIDEAIDKLYEERVELRESYLAENPDKESNIPEIVKPTRVDSMDGLELYGEIAPSLMKEDCNEDDISMEALSYFDNYEEYYIDIIRYSYGYLDFNLYVKEK